MVVKDLTEWTHNTLPTRFAKGVTFRWSYKNAGFSSEQAVT